ncbi:hypothetical protein KC325_g7 [Hortaea werneckii]|nr:hypothetical protein KC325_g7 [Hortaea werneckii]
MRSFSALLIGKHHVPESIAVNHCQCFREKMMIAGSRQPIEADGTNSGNTGREVKDSQSADQKPDRGRPTRSRRARLFGVQKIRQWVGRLILLRLGPEALQLITAGNLDSHHSHEIFQKAYESRVEDFTIEWPSSRMRNAVLLERDTAITIDDETFLGKWCLKAKEETELAREEAEGFAVGSMVPLDAFCFDRCDESKMKWSQAPDHEIALFLRWRFCSYYLRDASQRQTLLRQWIQDALWGVPGANAFPPAPKSMAVTDEKLDPLLCAIAKLSPMLMLGSPLNDIRSLLDAVKSSRAMAIQAMLVATFPTMIVEQCRECPSGGDAGSIVEEH